MSISCHQTGLSPLTIIVALWLATQQIAATLVQFTVHNTAIDTLKAAIACAYVSQQHCAMLYCELIHKVHVM